MKGSRPVPPPSAGGGRSPRAARLAAAVLLLPAVLLSAITIQVKGNDHFRRGVIAEALPPDPEKFSEEELAAWREDALFNAEDMYRRDGLFDARVSIALRPKEGGGPGDWVAEVDIQEGERYRFDTVRVVVVKDAADTVAIAPPAARAVVVEADDLDAEAGKPFREDLLFQDRRFILRKFGNAGFVRAQVEDKLTIRPATRTVGVDYLVEPSYPVLFDTLIIANRRARPADTAEGITDEEIFRDLLPYRRGDTMRVSDNDRLIEKLQYTGAYNYARLKDSLLAPEGGRSALILLTEERIPGSVRTSVFYETDYGAGVSADARHSNLAGTLNEGRGGASFAVDRQNGYLGYGSPLTFGRLVRFDWDVSADWLQNRSIHAEEGFFGGDFEGVNNMRLTVPWSYWLRLVGSAEVVGKSRLIAETDTTLSPARTDTLRERDVNTNLIQTSFLSFLNQAMDPTRGVRFALSLGNGGPLVRNEEVQVTEFRHNWVEVQSAYYYYYPPLRQFKLALRLDGGRFFGDGGTNSDRFFLGGPRSVRTYGFRELCPDTTCATRELEAAYYLVSQEIRMELFSFPIFSRRGFMKHLVPLQLVPFYDFGRVWDLDGESEAAPGVDPGKGVAFGVGFRYPLLGIFNFRMDFAYGAPNDGADDPPDWVPDRFVLDLAQAF